MRILIVCLGNICRSPIAEGIMGALIQKHGLDWTVASSGTNGYHTGEAPHRSSQKVCLQHGIDISAQRAARFTARDLEQYDVIYAMATDVYADISSICSGKKGMDKVKLFLSELEEGSTDSVPDPWYGDDSGYLPVYQLIEQTCRAIVQRYGKQGS